ncbi:MAG TPA: hypothetical protein DD723_01995 [Candidatus Omnitrophica bacterium]|nr:MAG: hypothetical protein A2Z81_09030 [Omnitrophica WOR_2 bacterium GWA2_45_18]HBR14298.1 hypothetical protein [Candidatus Omnitrophota bacterium]
MTNSLPEQDGKDDPLFNLDRRIKSFARDLLNEFNANKIKLTAIPSHKRIFVFFLTRAIKTYSAISHLSKDGYGQDTATLLRSLLENLISAKYILSDFLSADEKAVRFVAYKWIIFKRYVAHFGNESHPIKDSLLNELSSNMPMIQKKVEEFKSKYRIQSDKALITWSGRSIRDMAKMAKPSLEEEYDLTFRTSSRFSHPSIIGDHEYLDCKDDQLIFSPFPSDIGVQTNLKLALRYLLDFFDLFVALFDLKAKTELNNLREVFKIVEHDDASQAEPSSGKSNLKLTSTQKENIIIKFQTPSPDQY